MAGHPRVPYPNLCDWRVDEIFKEIKAEKEGKRINEPESVARVGRSALATGRDEAREESEPSFQNRAPSPPTLTTMRDPRPRALSFGAGHERVARLQRRERHPQLPLVPRGVHHHVRHRRLRDGMPLAPPALDDRARVGVRHAEVRGPSTAALLARPSLAVDEGRVMCANSRNSINPAAAHRGCRWKQW